MSSQSSIRLAVNYFPTGWHEGVWHGRPQASGLTTDIDYFRWLARAAEAAKLDALFLADTIGGLQQRSYRSLWGALDPTVLLGAVADATSNIGLVSTVSGLFGNPVEVARKIATLDHVSGGRAAWNIVTSQTPTTRSVFGVPHELERGERYARAEEFVQLVDAFWDSLPPEAIVADEASGVYLDFEQVRPVDFHGEHFQVGGVLPVTAGPHGKPVRLQAGASEESIGYGVRWADAIFTALRDLPRAQAFRTRVHARAEALGRRAPLLLPGIFIYPGATEQEALDRKAELDERISLDIELPLLAHRLGLQLDELEADRELPYGLLSERSGNDKVEGLPAQIVEEAQRNGWTARQVIHNNGLGAHRVVVGAGEQIAQGLLDWVDAGGADGFVISFGDYRHDFPIFAETVVPYLQRAGRFRSDYAGPRTTLRQNLGLD